MRRYHVLLSFGLLLAIISALGYFIIQASAQEDIISDLTKRLTEDGIPLKSIEVQSQIPFSLEITLQRVDEKAKPLEPFYVHAVKREVTLVQERGFKVDELILVILSTKGDVEYWVTEPIKEIAIETASSATDNDRVAILVSENLNLFGLNLDKIEVDSDQRQTQTISLQLRVPDIETANQILPEFMPSLRVLFDDLNKNSQTNIGICKVDLLDDKEQPLLHYVLDLQLDQESWWMAEGVTMDWFPHPLPPLPESTNDSTP